MKRSLDLNPEKKSSENTVTFSSRPHRSSLLLCGLSGKSQSHTVSGSPFGAPPCSPAHLPGPVHHGPSDAGRDINNKSWSRNHSGEHKGEKEGRCRPQPALLQVGCFDTHPDGSLMGAHGVTWVYVHVYILVDIISMVFMHSPPTRFFFTLKGDFPVAGCFGKSN